MRTHPGDISEFGERQIFGQIVVDIFDHPPQLAGGKTAAVTVRVGNVHRVPGEQMGGERGGRTWRAERTVTTAGATRLTTSAKEFCAVIDCEPGPGVVFAVFKCGGNLLCLKETSLRAC